MIENFKVTRIVFSGIAGGADPSLNVGDVVAPERWAEYLESVMARETTPGVFAPPPEEELLGAHLGMIYPKSVGVRGPDGRLSRVFWFPADRRLLSAARRAAVGVHLQRCVSKTLCLSTAPKVRVGGSGVSGPAFVDNAALRAFLFKAFSAQVIDMESAAVAHVAYADAVPFIAFRSLSDLAGGDPGKNQAYLLFKFAAGNSAAVVKAFLRALPEPPQPAPR
jgi:adenosylhomocysteine nucleosidase